LRRPVNSSKWFSRSGHVPEHRLDVAPLADDVAPADADRAAAGAALPDEHADGGRFAGPVRPEQPEQLAAADVEVEPVDGGEAAVPHPQPGDADHCVL
jgi:hypothetical protein